MKETEVWGADEFPIWKGVAFTIDCVDVVVILRWRMEWHQYHECCLFWRGPHHPEWAFVPQSAVDEEMQTPLGWVKHYPQLVELFEPVGKYAGMN